MDANTINALLSLSSLDTLSTQSSSGTDSTSGFDFSAMLNSMLDTSGTNGFDFGTTVDYSSILNEMTGGASLQDVQAQLLYKDAVAEEKPVVTDPVLSQILRDLRTLQSEGGEDGEVLGLLQQLQQRLRQLMEDEGAMLAAEQAVALLGQLIPMFSELDLAMVQSLTLDGGQSLELLLNQSPEALLEALVGQDADAQETLLDTVVATDGAQAQQAQNGATQAEVPVTSVQVQAKEETPQQIFAQMLETGEAQSNFANAVRTVREQLAGSDAEAQELDVDELQKQVDGTDLTARVGLADIDTAAQELNAVYQPVEAQLQEAVAGAIANGQEQITLTLNPEELGEVTIQMQRLETGGFLLNIIAKNPETQRMLAADMAQLQQNLKPMKVELESITTQRDSVLEGYQQQFDGQRRQNWQQMNGAPYYGEAPLAKGEEGQPVMAQAVPTSALDAYI